MSNPKEKHYWNQLRAVITSGQWTSSTPARAPNAAPLSWSELVRKFNKHCRGFSDIAEIALQTRTLYLLLGSNLTDDDHDDTQNDAIWPLLLADTSILPEERKEEATEVYNALQRLQTSNHDTLHLTLAYFAYALGDPSACIEYVEKVSDIGNVTNHIPNPANTSANGSQLQPPTPVTHSSSSSSWTGSFVSDYSALSIQCPPEIAEGKTWALIESIRGLCLKGMSMEKLHPESPERALETYNTALPLLAMASNQMEWSASTSDTHSANTSSLVNSAFSSTRELWRWAERTIWRGVVLSSKSGDISDRSTKTGLWAWLEQYSTCSLRWPPTFRPRHRATVCMLHLHASVLSAHATTSTRPTSQWLATSRAMVTDYQSVLNASTKFPKAGERNIKVEDFVDLCIAVWEAGGASGDQAPWVIDVLWWATRLTFNCPRIFRHMTRLCQIAGDTNLARRFLRLYVQIVQKQFQTSEADVQIEGMETDEQWIQTLEQGARMLCRLAVADKGEVVEEPEAAGRLPGDHAVNDAREAAQLVEKARSRLGQRGLEGSVEEREKWQYLRARVDLAEGVAYSVLALTEQDSLTRAKKLAHAHKMFLNAVSPPTSTDTFKSTPSANYHLALSYTRPGPMLNLDQAAVHAGLAVEGQPNEVRFWHLLGLILATKELWDEASDALERGAALGDQNVAEEEVANGFNKPYLNGVRSKDYADRQVEGLPSGDQELKPHPVQSSIPRLPDAPTGSLLTSTSIPSSETLLSSIPDYPPPLRQDALDYSLEIRMSQMTLVEYMGGSDLAEAKGVEVFQWMSSKRRTTTKPRKFSHASKISGTPSEGLVGLERTSHDTVQAGSSTNIETPPLPIPINVEPATPGHSIDDTQIGEKGAEDLSMNGTGSDVASARLSGDTSRSKKVQQMLKEGVHKGHERIKKIGTGVVKSNLRRTNSTPDFHALLRTTSYQASSIHSRRRAGSIRAVNSPPHPDPPSPPLPRVSLDEKADNRSKKEKRMLSRLWLMSAATFRRAGKIEQSKGALQEAEVVDEGNPDVWVQLGLYYLALGHDIHAVDAFQKALFIAPDFVPAVVHLARTYLTRPGASRQNDGKIHPNLVDLASGMLTYSTAGAAWNVPEAWYYLAKAYELQGRKGKQRDCLATALKLSESRGIREISAALGWCL